MSGHVSWICGVFVAGCILQPPPLSPVYAHYHDPHHHHQQQQHYQPWHRHRPPPIPRVPVELMTDIVNDVGTRVLQQYVDSGNVAFSPAGVGFILAALYEGSAGRSRQQIVDCLGLPRDRNVVRVGLRDIHRRLRTYLNPDGFLGGLNLNRENTTLRPDYENILRFYGFDLSIDLSNFAANNTGNFGLKGSTLPPVTSQTQMATTPPPGSTMMPNGAGTAAGQTVPPTTVPQIPTGMPAGATMAPDGGTMTTVPPAGTTTIDTSVVLVTTMLPTDMAAQTASTAAPTTTMAATPAMTTVTDGAQAAATSMTTTLATTTAQQPTTLPPTTQPPTTQPPTTTMSAANAALISTTLPRMPSPTPGNRAFLTTGETTTTDLPTTTTTMPTTTTMGSSGAETTTPAEDIATVAAPTIIPALVRRRRSRRTRRSNEGYFSNYPDDGLWMQDLDIYADQPALPTNVRDFTELQFLVNGCDLATVPAATYTAVLPFAYFPSLKAVALEFPLDNPRYNVLLFLPTETVDTSRLARELGGQNLRMLRRQLQPTWLRATIPSFMLRGFVTLTPYLQRLGIRDVFEPRLADLTPMTPDLGVYARDVQQSIAVNIRNYMKPDPNSMNPNTNPNINMNVGPNQNGNMGMGQGGNGGQNGQGGPGVRNPPPEDPPLIVPSARDAYRYMRPVNDLHGRVSLVSFTAEHPFLYFIIDNETSVSLIAGRIDDPLNSRIL